VLGEVLQSVLATVRQVGEEIGGDGKYFCIAAASNGKLYAAPRNASRVLEIDPESATVRQVGEGIEGDGKYLCIAAASNGKLYDAPCNAALRASRAFHSVLPARHRQPPFMQHAVGLLLVRGFEAGLLVAPSAMHVPQA